MVDSLACQRHDRPVNRLAWNNVDLDARTLLSFERPSVGRFFS
jgi:hypothetical protein